MALMNKPIVVGKIRDYMRKLKNNDNKVGTIPRAITLNYNNICNFKCDFCFSADETNEHIKETLDLEKIVSLFDEAHELGVWEVVLTGGELTLNKEKLISLIKALKPERFQVILITNGWLITEDYVKELGEAGLDCLAVSISGMNEEEHDTSRHVKGAHKKALEALALAKKGGLAAWPNVIYGHHNAFSQDLIDLLEHAKVNNYSVYFMMAMPFGSYKDSYMDSNDIERLNWLRKEYNCFFDTWDMYDKNKERISGCWTMNRTYIAPNGDLFPCPYLPIKVGNIYEQSLKEIYDYGFSIKYFGEYSPICIAAHNRKFREKFLSDETKNVFNPVIAKDVFQEDDYIKG